MSTVLFMNKRDGRPDNYLLTDRFYRAGSALSLYADRVYLYSSKSEMRSIEAAS